VELQGSLFYLGIMYAVHTDSYIHNAHKCTIDTNIWTQLFCEYYYPEILSCVHRCLHCHKTWPLTRCVGDRSNPALVYKQLWCN